MAKWIVTMIAVLALAACDTRPDNASGGVSQAESDALNNAAEMLDAQSVAPRVGSDAPK